MKAKLKEKLLARLAEHLGRNQNSAAMASFGIWCPIDLASTTTSLSSTIFFDGWLWLTHFYLQFVTGEFFKSSLQWLFSKIKDWPLLVFFIQANPASAATFHRPSWSWRWSSKFSWLLYFSLGFCHFVPNMWFYLNFSDFACYQFCHFQTYSNSHS